MDDADSEYLSQLDCDLRAKKDRSDAIDELFQMTICADAETEERVSWCLAKMAQNKYADMRIHSILMSMKDSAPEVLENVAWGLGELAGTSIGDADTLAFITDMMKHPSSPVRSMAAWAAGRYRRRLDIQTEESEEVLRSLLDDRSPLVKKSAEFAISNEE